MQLADAGYLVGHLESLCGTRRLLDTRGSVEAYLTACDHAADRLQTHHPTAVLRFDPAERAIVARGTSSLGCSEQGLDLVRAWAWQGPCPGG